MGSINCTDYEIYSLEFGPGALEAALKVEAFTTILGGTKGGDKEKRLSSQFIGRFFKRFKNLEEESFNCLLDLCDDPDVAIRKQAVQDLQSICKQEPAFTSRVADVLVQMLATDDHSKNVTAGAFLKYTLEKVIPYFEPISSELDRRGILRVLTEFSMHPGDAFLSCSETEGVQLLCPLHSLLLSSLPTVPEDPLLALSSTVEPNAGSGECQSTKSLIPEQVSNLNILEIECLLFSIVNLSKLLPSFLDFTDPSSGDSASIPEAASRVRNLRPKLQYLARLIQLHRRNILSSTEELLKLEEIAQESVAEEAKQVTQ
ncbi:unnamed protein product [Dibothriocephalus latus]|uniref:Uncharacterized protein n=1 Tax=Dibothriocephalus latus TaxID=60516 RepID=A0A3P7MW08_DIBLA|nr:unnamed protein product [Dibothriocephalus latus]